MSGIYSASQTPSGLADILSFANNGSDYGGDFGLVGYATARRCITNYFSGPLSEDEKDPTVAYELVATDFRNFTAKEITYQRLKTIMCGTNRIYSQYDVVIVGPITGGCSKRLNLSVRGDADIAVDKINGMQLGVLSGAIRIHSNVTKLTNVFLSARATAINGPSSASNGAIYTCQNGSGAAPSITECGSQLVIAGSLAAQRIFLGRTYGNVAQPCETTEAINYASKDTSFGTIPYLPSGTVDCTNAAEVFVNTYQVDERELYENDRIDSITSLPPVF